MKIRIKVVLIILLMTNIVISQAKTYEDSLFSKSLNKTMYMSIVVPSAYSEQKPIPILYLLHGFGGNHKSFIPKTNIVQLVEDASVLCVMPQADNSFYINSLTQPNNKYEDYLIYELLEHINKKFNIDEANQTIAGFSMGGYGATVLGLKHPDKFEFVASIAGGLMIPGEIETYENLPRYEFVKPTTDKVFGELPTSFREEHDPFLIYKEIPREDLPYIFIFTALQDFYPEIVTEQRKFSDSLNTYGAFHEYHELQGSHDYKTVDASMNILLGRIEYFTNQPYKSLSSVLSQILFIDGVEQAISKYHELKQRDKTEYNFNEGVLNILGYQLLSKNKLDEAIKIFNLNVEEYPDASNPYDSLGEAYMLKGNKKLAIKNYKRSLELNPDNKNAIEMIKKLGKDYKG